ncbi:FadR/GntR family transcriptional regulator [Brevibacterium oceani]|uniref:FadR/GntR family transcriptional regulator n=1 Tax=Brevibacterium oceani TaxID=358099 RepID=UPI0015E75BE5|nr:FCD domain-containing protein [Brevibacterium oceani]
MAQITDDVQNSAEALLPRSGTRSRPLSRGEHLAESIRDAIRERELGAGDFFGTLETIREETGLARTTVSEAVKLLRDRGVLVVRPGRGGGLFVAKTTPIVRLRHTLMRVEGDPASAADAIELRESLEELIAVKAAVHRSAADCRELEAVLSEMRAAQTWDDFMQCNWKLHAAIAAICPNSMARPVYESTLGFLSSAHAEQDGEVDASYWGTRLQVHEDLVAAITAGDLEAVRAAVADHASSRS